MVVLETWLVPSGKLLNLHFEVHGVAGIVHITCDLDAADLFSIPVEDDSHGIIRLHVTSDCDLDVVALGCE